MTFCCCWSEENIWAATVFSHSIYVKDVMFHLEHLSFCWSVISRVHVHVPVTSLQACPVLSSFLDRIRPDSDITEWSSTGAALRAVRSVHHLSLLKGGATGSDWQGTWNLHTSFLTGHCYLGNYLAVFFVRFTAILFGHYIIYCKAGMPNLRPAGSCACTIHWL